MLTDKTFDRVIPVVTFLLGLGLWEGLVRYNHVPIYILPPPSLVLYTLYQDWPTLSGSLWVTLTIMGEALFMSIVGSLALAVVFSQSRLAERAFYPFAVALQVTPVVSIAPLLLVYLSGPEAVLVCAFLVSFFPLLANTTLGLNSADHNLVDLFKLYRATRFQELWLLRLPSALPYFLAGLRISGGLALIGAIVAEIAAGTAGRSAGLAFRIVKSGFRLNIARMFAALLLIALVGVLIHLILTALTHWLLHDWHDSASTRES